MPIAKPQAETVRSLPFADQLPERDGSRSRRRFNALSTRHDERRLDRVEHDLRKCDDRVHRGDVVTDARVGHLQADVAYVFSGVAPSGPSVSVWTGASELSATVTVWSGSTELPASVTEVTT